MLYPPPIQCQKLTQSAISQKPIEPKEKKNLVLENIFLHLYVCFGAKIQNTNGQNLCVTFWTSVKSTLNGPANGQEVTYSKI